MLFSWFSQGAWRKITVTHYLPLRKKPQEDTDGGNVQSEGVREGEESLEETREVLLPRTVNTCELWPAILTKAILKVAALEYVYIYIYTHMYHTHAHTHSSKTGSEWKEFGDCSVLHMMTGWYPQTLPTRYSTSHTLVPNTVLQPHMIRIGLYVHTYMEHILYILSVEKHLVCLCLLQN